MAIEQVAATVAVATEECTWRVNIETPKGGDPVVTVFREVVKTATDGAVISNDTGPVASRNLSGVATEQ